MEIGRPRVLAAVLAAGPAAIALLGVVGAARAAAAPEHCGAVVLCVDAEAGEAAGPAVPCIHDPACGGGAALGLGLLLVGVAAAAFALPAPHAARLRAAPPPVHAPATPARRTPHRPPR